MIEAFQLHAFRGLAPRHALVVSYYQNRWHSMGWTGLPILKEVLRMVRVGLSTYLEGDVPARVHDWPELYTALRRLGRPTDRLAVEDAALEVLNARGLSLLDTPAEALAELLANPEKLHDTKDLRPYRLPLEPDPLRATRELF